MIGRNLFLICADIGLAVDNNQVEPLFTLHKSVTGIESFDHEFSGIKPVSGEFGVIVVGGDDGLCKPARIIGESDLDDLMPEIFVVHPGLIRLRNVKS
jgi:hypothetical protein